MKLDLVDNNSVGYDDRNEQGLELILLQTELEVEALELWNQRWRSGIPLAYLIA